MHKYQQVSTSGFLLNKNKEVLIVKRSDADDFLPGLWELPGGGTDFGENPSKALQREMQEETGLAVEVGKALYVADYFMERDKEKIHRIEVFFLCFIPHNMAVTLSNEHQEYKWVAQTDIVQEEMTDYTQKAIFACFKNEA